MASTFDNDLRLEEMATGENAGSWGTKTNTNLELIADAFGYGTFTIADADTTLTIPDGSGSDNALRSLYLKISSSADLTTTRVLTIDPNTVSKLWYIENNTSGGQTITISQGSGANVNILNGQAKLVATDGASAGAAVIDVTQDLAIPDLFIDDDLSLQSDGAVINFGTDAEIQLTHVADTGLLLTETGGGAPTLQFRDSALSISSSADGQLDIDSDGTIDINATTSIAFDTDTLYVDTTNDRVGVNVAAPSVPLEVNVTGATDVIKFTRDTGTAGALTLDFSGANANFDSEAGGYNFETSAATNALFIKSDGLIGVGTNAPSHPSGGGLTVFNSTVPRVALRNDTTGNTSTDGGELLMSGNQMYLQNREDSDLFLTQNATTRLSIKSGEAVFNDAGNDYDFRVESDTSTHMLFVDALNNRVGINDSGPVSTLTVNGDILSNWGNSGEQKIGIAGRGSNVFSSSEKTLIITGADAAAGAQAMQGGDVIVRGGVGAGNEGLNIYAGHLYLEGGLHTGGVGTESGAGRIYMKTAGYERLNINQYGGVIINEVGDDADFRVESSNKNYMLLVDAGSDHVAIGGTLSTTNSNLTVNANDSAVYASNTLDTGGGLSIYKYTNTNTNNDSVGLAFRVTTDNASTNALGAIRYVQPAYNSFAGRMMFQTRNSNGNYYENMRLDSQSGFLANAEGDSFFDFAINSDSYTGIFKVDAGANQITMGGTGSNDAGILTLGSPGQATYVTNVSEGELGIVRFNNTQTSTQHSGIVFRVTTNNASNNSYGSFGLIQPTYNRHDSRFYFNLRSQSNNTRQYANIDSEVGWQINDGGEAHIDFRVESDNESNMLFVDANNDTVSINNTQTTYHLGVGANYVSNEGLFGVQRALGYSRHAFSGSGGGATKTVTITLSDYGLNALEIHAYVTGHRYNSGPNNFAVHLVHVAMEESGTMRINSDQTSALGYRLGNQEAQVGSMSVSSTGGGNITATFTVGGEYDTRILIEVKGPAVNYISSVTHS